MKNDGTVEKALTALGFTDMEAKLYCDLLRHGSASGYRLAMRTGKAAANTYQALGTLTQKGAVLVSDESSEKKVYSAFPPKLLLNVLRQQFEKRRTSALEQLESIYEPNSDERVYAVTSVDQVLERARTMLANAKQIILFDFFPEIYDLLREDVDDARRRGVTVAGIAYERHHAEAWMPLNKESTELVSARWPGLGLILIVDGSEQLIAQLARDMKSVLNGVWSDSVFLSCVFHSAVAADIRLVALRADSSDPLRSLSLQGSAPLGLKKLLESTEATSGSIGTEESCW